MIIEWSTTAEKQFFKIIEYIRQDSELNAEKVGRTIIKMLYKLLENRERYRLENYKQPNDGTYRYFIKYQYRISYRVVKKGIKIIRIKHQKRKPSFL